MKYNRELKGWEKFLTRFQIPYIKFVYSRDAFDDWRIEIYRAYWKFRPKNYRVEWTNEDQRKLEELTMDLYGEFKRQKEVLLANDRYLTDKETGAHLRRGPITNRDLGDEA